MLLKKQTSEPITITGLRPTLSAIFPLNGRDTMAVTVNSEMISPLYCAPPRLVK